MSCLAGVVAKTYDFRETNRDGVYEQVILNSDFQNVGLFYTRFHISIAPTKIVSKEEKFGLTKNQLEGLSLYGSVFKFKLNRFFKFILIFYKRRFLGVLDIFTKTIKAATSDLLTMVKNGGLTWVLSHFC